ncbi:glycosyltransferase family 4 protein [uncultured Jatrophihabitans sp.]|uniref:glycosyltransferase family 4 protein n=1 Tax=uncultured Jatrophihabitans sp. TaxID=1610747 RepID=UPI0035CC9B38
MFINLHDYSGHPFQIDLSRELARRGHRVAHTYCAQYVTGRGNLQTTDADSPGLTIAPLATRVPFEKYQMAGRVRFEIAYGIAWRRYLKRHDFDAVISCNVPLLSQAAAERGLRARRTPWIFWHQDIYSKGVVAELRRKRILGGRRLEQLIVDLERRQVERAASVVAISQSFVDQYSAWDIKPSRVAVVRNWAPIDEIYPVDRDNSWSRLHEIPTDRLRLLYSGTLGRKHNPALLLWLLDALHASGVNAFLTTCSEGEGADDLMRAAGSRDDVAVFGFQPAARLREVLGSGDVLVTLLEPDASEFSIPSKVTSYLSAGRPVVGLMPATNPAACDIVAAGGFTSTPDRGGAHAAADWIRQLTPDSMALRGSSARSFAESHYDVQQAADAFEEELSAIAPGCAAAEHA